MKTTTAKTTPIIIKTMCSKIEISKSLTNPYIWTIYFKQMKIVVVFVVVVFVTGVFHVFNWTSYLTWG